MMRKFERAPVPWKWQRGGHWSLEEHEENARITDRTSTELRTHRGGGNFVYNRHGPDFAEDAGGGPSSPVRKGRRRRE